MLSREIKMKLRISRRICVRTCHCNIIRKHVTAAARGETLKLKIEIMNLCVVFHMV